MNRVKELEALGQSVWLDFLSREFLASDDFKRMIAEDARPKQPGKTAAAYRSTPVPRPPDVPAAPPPADVPSAAYNRERLRDYIAAFVLAGLDPQVGAETEFFANPESPAKQFGATCNATMRGGPSAPSPSPASSRRLPLTTTNKSPFRSATTSEAVADTRPAGFGKRSSWKRPSVTTSRSSR